MRPEQIALPSQSCDRGSTAEEPTVCTTHRWREMDSNHRSPVTCALCRRGLPLLRGSGSGSARFLLLGGPFHRAGLPYGLGGLRFAALLGRFFFPAVRFIYTLALYRLDQQFAERPDQGGRLLHFRERYDMRRMRPAASAARFGAAWRTGM